MTTLSTGIDALDRRLGGGFSEGHTVAMVTTPDTPSVRILHELMRQRPTVYITTLRPRSAIESELAQLDDENMDVTVRAAGEVKHTNEMLHSFTESSIYSANIDQRERIFDEVNEIIGTVENGQNVVVDPMNPLETSENKTAYVRLLRSIADQLRDVDGLGIFHCLSFRTPPRLREKTLTMVDSVWDLDMNTDNDDNLELQMTIPKNRSGKLVFERVTLLINENDITTDRSRGI